MGYIGQHGSSICEIENCPLCFLPESEFTGVALIAFRYQPPSTASDILSDSQICQ